MLKKIAKMSVRKHSKQRPKSLQYSVTIPPQMARGIGIALEDRSISLKLEGNKIVIEKLK